MNRLRTISVMGAALLTLALAACSSAAPAPAPTAAAKAAATTPAATVAAATPTVAATPAGPVQITMTPKEDGDKYSFDPAALNLKAGQQVVVHFVNPAANTKAHTFELKALDGSDIVKSDQVKAGASLDIPFTVPAQGKYQFLCYQRGHADRGQTGTLTVTGA